MQQHSEKQTDGFEAETNSALFLGALHAFVAVAVPVLLSDSAVVSRTSLKWWAAAEAILSLVAFASYYWIRQRDVERFVLYSQAESLGAALTFSAFAWLGPEIATATPSKHILMIAVIAVTSVSAANSSHITRRRPFFNKLIVIVGASYSIAYLVKGEWIFAVLTLIWCIAIAVLTRVGYNGMVELLELRQASEKTARHDDLTGLLSRSAFFEILDRSGKKRTPEDEQPMLILFDLDGFKAINDSYGHAAGDAVLQAVSKRLALFLPETASLGRLGGDEFAAIMEGAPDELEVTVDAALAALSDPIRVDGRELYVAASAGWTRVDPNEDSPVLMAQADAAMYRSKNSPSQTSTGFNGELRRELDRALDLRQRFRAALKRDEIEFWAQPIARMIDGAPVAVELLARWPQADGSYISPEEFTRVADETGLAAELDRHALRAADRLLLNWLAHPVLGSLTVKANISPVHLHNNALIASVRELVREPLRMRLGLEFVESQLISAAERNHEQMRELMDMGIVLSVDDFGVGYSSLAYLRTLPVSEIKIDRSFVTAVDTDAINQGMIRAIVDIAATLGLPTVAEGIETPEEFAEIARVGVIAGQGYLISQPTPVADLERVLTSMAKKATSSTT